MNISTGFIIKTCVTFGTTNQQITFGALGLFTANYNDIGIESMLHLHTSKLFKKHTVKTKGYSFGFDFSTLLGFGQNSNLLGSSLAKANYPLLFNARGNGGFSGFGFGFKKDYLPGSLSVFNIKQGKFLMRFSKNKHSFNIVFNNDFKFGRLFNGEATDFGPTGSLEISFSRITSQHSIYKVGMGVALFTPKPEYSKTPNNPVNSDDGRKNVWYTTGAHSNVFYANLYGLWNYTDANYSTFIKTGINSQKLGAYIQNTIHDSFGLNPRYPWQTALKDKIHFQMSGSGFKSYKYDN